MLHDDQVIKSNVLPKMFVDTYDSITEGNDAWNGLVVPKETLYPWDPKSTYIHKPAYLENITMTPPGPPSVKDAYCLLSLGDSITTDHISPSGVIKPGTPAAKYLLERGVKPENFTTYGSRRANDEIVVRGAFANIRIVNKLLEGEVGPKTVHVPTGEKHYVFDAAMVCDRLLLKLHQNYLYSRINIQPLTLTPWSIYNLSTKSVLLMFC